MNNYIENIEEFCARHNVVFDAEGECGFVRECVGIRKGNKWIDYNPINMTTYDYIETFYDERLHEITPKDAYHKHNCLAVLGRGEDAIEQLSEWVDGLKDLGVSIERYNTGATGFQAVLSGSTSWAVRTKD